MTFINSVEINNFRCFYNKTIEFSQGINIIKGDNATGKTSIVEALYMIGMGKSFRSTIDSEVINIKNDFSLIKSKVCCNNQTHNISISIVNNGKQIFVNNNKVKKLSSYLGFINIIAFSPDDIQIVKGEPKRRRRFLDISISQTNSSYLNNLIDYNKTLKERNELLKRFESIINAENLLKLYDEKLFELSKPIMDCRKRFLNDLETIVNRKIKVLSNDKETVKIVYNPNCNVDNLLKEFNNRINLDRISKTTSCGLHRDDFSIIINDKEAKSFASQGQQKTIALAMKLALADYVLSIKGNVIIVLDDVFGELDNNRQNQVLKLFNNNSQVFITTTNIDNIDNNILQNSKIINI